MTHLYDIGCDYDDEYDMVNDCQQAARRLVFEAFIKRVVSYMEDGEPEDLMRCRPALQRLVEMKEDREKPDDIAAQIDMILVGERRVGRL